MLEKEYHRLLKRQLKDIDKDLLYNPSFNAFLNIVNDAYRGYTKDIDYIENILIQSSKELLTLNQQLKNERDFTKSRLKNIVDNVGGVIFETDAIGNFTYLNNEWQVYSGFSIQESLGKNYKKFLIKNNIESEYDINTLFSNGNKTIEFIFYHKIKKNIRWFELKSKALNDENNITLGFIGTIIEITKLKETQIELQKASKSKDEFLSTMSHEIRTPLNAVTGLTNILLMENYLPDQVEHLKALKYSGEHLLGLINDLLDFSKIKSGKIKLTEKDFSLKCLLEKLDAQFAIRAENKGVQFTIKKCGTVPNHIIGDELKLTQVLKNLLSNSLKFTEKGQITLKVENLDFIRNKIKLEFTVTDTGIGITKERQKRIFQSFLQANDDTSIKYGGTGLGLAISKKLLKLQKSKLKVNSVEGEGSSFSFKISYKVSNRLNAFKPDMVKTELPYEPLKINVLVAEDNKMNILILTKFFKKWHISFEVAENGREVLEFFKAKDFLFDVILMDLQMPILDGYKTTQIIRKMENAAKASVPIIALTAFAQTDIKQKTKQYGMTGFMSKPFNPAELYNVLKSFSTPCYK